MSDKIWLSLCAVAFLVISGSIVKAYQDGAFADNSSQNNQPSTTTKSNPHENLPASVKSSATEDQDQHFLSVLESTVSMTTKESIKEIPDSTKIAAGKLVCQSFSKGVTSREFATMILQKYGNSPSTIELAGALMGAGVTAYCPEYSQKLP